MINGIINIYKEAGYTSHDVVARLRGIVKQKKIGHTGTLDPDAVGVLPVCFGNATKLCDMLTDKSKEYEACMLLGVTTDTLDMSGQILTESTVDVSEEAVKEAIMSFEGGYDQIPPMYSALKVNGKKLYELAREGKEIERKPRHVEIPFIEIISMELPKVVFRVSCSKGTYIRSLCADIGDKLGCGAAMESLKRTRVGSFMIEDSLTLAQIEDAMAKACIEDYVLASDEVFMEYLGATVRQEFDKVLANGNKLIFSQLELEQNRLVQDGELIRIYNSQKVFSGVYVYEKTAGCLKPFKMFLT